MRIAYLDCFSGISGDMFLGAAVDAGVPVERLQSVAASLGLNAELAASRTVRGGISASKIDVLVHGVAEQPGDPEPEHAHAASHASSQAVSHTHSHAHSHAAAQAAHRSEGAHRHRAGDASAPHAHRGLKEIRRIIESAPISPAARDFAVRAFELLAHAEAKIHGCDPESIHFHEVGSEDAIVDIVCAAVAAEAIAAERWYCSALNLGSGTVRCAHGVLPVPAPATAELLRGAPVYSSGVQKELLTPTGAAILRALDVRFEPLPRMRISATGYGAGARELAGAANVVRLIVGEPEAERTAVAPQLDWQAAATEDAAAETIVVIEANLDDMNPQLVSWVQQKLLDAGALDVFAAPVQMKKGRPGLVFSVLGAPAQAEALSRILLTETTTLGVRMRQEQRRILAREHATVESCWGPLRIKLGRLHGEVVNSAPEFEDCRRVAEANGVPLKTVLQEAMRLYFEARGSEPDSSASRRPGDAAEDILS